MPIIISSKGSDFNAWRTAENFGTAFREELLKKTATLTSEQAEALFQNVEQELNRRAEEHGAALTGLRSLISEAGAANDPARLRSLVQEFYSASYDLYGRTRSAPVFYKLSEEFLVAVSASVINIARGRLGELSGKLPPLSLIALGPAGRHEFSPFCTLQLLLVHGECSPSSVELLGHFGRILHEEYETVGIQPDQVITTRNPDWRGDLIQWRKRLISGMESGAPADMIALLRLADQSVLLADGGPEDEFGSLCLSLLHESRPTQAFMVTRVMGLSNGLGMMGGLRLEKFGPNRGLFAFFDHALLPFSASVTALSLIKGGNVAGTRQRIRYLLLNRELNVDMAERMLLTWHTLNELRLARERDLFSGHKYSESLYLDVDALPDAELELLRDALETVASMQHHVTITFSGLEEQTAC